MRKMKSRKILYIIAGVFNCIIGGMGIFFGLIVLLLGGFVKAMFESSLDLVHEFTSSMAEASSEYEYLTTISDAEAIAFIMKIVYIICAVALILGAIWITFGVFNFILVKKHDSVFGTKKFLKHLFVIGSWLLLTLNVANILTTIAVYKKDKSADTQQKLYTAS